MTDRTDPTDPEVSPAEVLLVEERLRAVAVDVRPAGRRPRRGARDGRGGLGWRARARR